MISYLEGVIKHKGLGYLILLTGGVGYKVYVPNDILTKISPLPRRSTDAIGTEAGLSLFIHTHVKDDALDLYGFTNPDDLALFELFLRSFRFIVGKLF